MSPAKRKSAKTGRAATAAARGGKARDKARGSALTKAVKVKGKTPAKGGDHRLKAQTGAKAGARNGAGVACDMPREQLELLLDRDEGRADVLSHVPACHPCTTSLTVIASQRDAIRHLTAEPSGTAVEYLLERGARAGERRLADLVYELAKACLVVVKDIDRRVQLQTRPRAQIQIDRDVRMAAARLESESSRALAARLPSTMPGEVDALVAAKSCITILDRLEGESERQQLASSVALICAGQPAGAEAVLRRLMSHQPSPYRLHAIHNLLWAQIRQQQFERALDTGLEAQADYPDDWLITYNMVAASVRLGRRADFERFARRLRTLNRADDGDEGFNTRLLKFETSRMSDDLGIDEADVVRALGLNGHSRAASHA